MSGATHWFSCAARLGSGGLGRHLGELVETARQEGALGGCWCADAPDNELSAIVLPAGLPRWWRYTPLRASPGWSTWCHFERWDRTVAGSMKTIPGHFTGFVGQSLHSFRRARALGSHLLELVAANSHVLNVDRLHEQAIRRNPLESSWLNGAQIHKTLAEYRVADVIQVASEYTRQSFLREGFDARQLRRVYLSPHPRFVPPASRPDDGVFRVVFTGSLTVMKGIPLLIEAFERLPMRDKRLYLVGGWASRGMRRYLTAAMAADPRIELCPGDPLPYLQQADVFVHPTWEDGFGYAPAEAMACGTPVIVTAETGASESVREGENGYIIAAGDVDALYERLLQLHASPLRIRV